MRERRNANLNKKNYLNAAKESKAEIIDISITYKYFYGMRKRICNADVAIIADMMDYQYHFDSIILASGDGDFEYTLKKLAIKGKKLYCF
ncbi:MAG: NYN domain-containing protein [Patescibacteria group bacterium]|nr:NYN domain-containing protein [Patescibacteria group bacterium]